MDRSEEIFANRSEMNSLFPTNPSLAEEMFRLFARPTPSLMNIETSSDSDDDFDRNGISREFNPETSSAQQNSHRLFFDPILDPPLGLRRFPSETPVQMPLSSEASAVSVDLRISSGSFGSSGEDFRSKSRSRKSALSKMAASCAFCRNNGEEMRFFRSHDLRGSNGKVTCPVLRAYTCPICNASGDNAHTLKYCPKNMDTANSVYKASRTATGRKKNLNIKYGK